MAASTITRDTWTNDTGTAANPNADGTIINNTRLQDDIYGRIDQMFAGAGAYAAFTFGGRVIAEGFGSHTFSAGGTGSNTIDVRNTTAGTGNFAGMYLGNDASATAAQVAVMSSTYTDTGFVPQDGMLIQCSRAGGIRFGTNHASGAIRFFTGSAVEAMRITAAGLALIGDTTNANMTVGLTINQGANDDEALALKSSDVAHGVTDVAETDTFARFKKFSATDGGLLITGFADAGGQGVVITGVAPTGDTTKGIGSVGRVSIHASDISGTNTTTAEANSNLLTVGDSSNTRFILDADGDSHQDVGTAWTNFDDHDDIALLHALSAGVSRRGDPLRRRFGRLLQDLRPVLERARIVTFNTDGHHFINWSRAHMLSIGAIRQVGEQLVGLEARLRAAGI